MDWFDLLAVRGSQESSSTLQFRSINSSALSFLYGPTLTSIHNTSRIHVKTAAEIRVMQAQVKEYLGLPEAGGGKEGPSCRDSRWSMALIIFWFLDYYSPHCERINFVALSHQYMGTLLWFSQNRSLPMGQFFASRGQSIGASASASVLPKNIQDWFPLEWTGLISLQFKGLSSVFSNTTAQKHQFFSAQLSLYSNSHIHTWLLEKP